MITITPHRCGTDELYYHSVMMTASETEMYLLNSFDLFADSGVSSLASFTSCNVRSKYIFSLVFL